MGSITEKIEAARKRVAQLERQKRAQEIREKKARERINTRRNIIIGKMVEQYFPEVLEFIPRRTEAETKVEFAPLEHFISMLAADIEYVERLKASASMKDFAGGSDNG